MNLSHTETYRVHRYDVGRNMRLRPTRLCDYLEDAAGAHAEALGVGLDDLRALGLAWVLAKMRLDIDRLPGAGEEVRVRTRPIGIERLQFRRDFTVYVGDEEIARAVTQWVIFNLASRRLERIPLHVAALTPDTPDPAMEDADIRPEDPCAWTTSTRTCTSTTCALPALCSKRPGISWLEKKTCVAWTWSSKPKAASATS